MSFVCKTVASGCLVLAYSSKMTHNFEHLLVEVFNTLFIGGNAVMRSLHPRKEKVRHLSSAESNSSGELDFDIVRLLKNVVKGTN